MNGRQQEREREEVRPTRVASPESPLLLPPKVAERDFAWALARHAMWRHLVLLGLAQSKPSGIAQA